ncbi:MAG: hypothetical protein JNL21_36745 [Myxococcales bacterium]|nr:hypothetical protein [Myxococcales bacterium]
MWLGVARERAFFSALIAGAILLGACDEDAEGSGGESETGAGAGQADAASTAGPGPAATTGASTGIGAGPHVAAHGLSFYRYGETGAASIDSPPLDTRAAGSTLVVSTGRGDLSTVALPTDSFGNSSALLGSPHAYTLWPTSGTAVHAFEDVLGGPGHVVSSPTASHDEITLAVVEVAGATRVADVQWVERLAGSPLTSAPVTTTRPSTLVAFWWGDAGVDGEKIATPNNGFVVLDSIGEPGSLVQCFVAAKDVAEPGTHDVTWEATPAQGAQLWLVAVE